MTWRRSRFAVVAALCLGLLSVGAASATYAGANGRIAFGMDVGPSAEPPDIYTVLPDGEGLQRLTYDPAADICPTYSADGREIAFCSNRTGASEIWTMTADGRDERQVTHLGQNSIFPDFSPDGRRIAFQNGGPANADVYVVERASGVVTRLTTTPGLDGYPAYSPDGTQIVFLSARSGVQQVWVMNADGSNPRQLTFDPAPKDQVPDWSPDGRRIAYQASATPGNGDIWVMDADGSNQRQLTRTPQNDFGTAWSPDGTQIAFARGFGAAAGAFNRAIYVVNADGTGEHRVAQGTRVPAWQPSAVALGSCAVAAADCAGRDRERGR